MSFPFGARPPARCYLSFTDGHSMFLFGKDHYSIVIIVGIYFIHHSSVDYFILYNGRLDLQGTRNCWRCLVWLLFSHYGSMGIVCLPTFSWLLWYVYLHLVHLDGMPCSSPLELWTTNFGWLAIGYHLDDVHQLMTNEKWVEIAISIRPKLVL